MLHIIFNTDKSEIDFTLCKRLRYYKKDSDFHLCISAVLEKKIFKIAHDDNTHEKHDKALQ